MKRLVWKIVTFFLDKLFGEVDILYVESRTQKITREVRP